MPQLPKSSMAKPKKLRLDLHGVLHLPWGTANKHHFNAFHAATNNRNGRQVSAFLHHAEKEHIISVPLPDAPCSWHPSSGSALRCHHVTEQLHLCIFCSLFFFSPLANQLLVGGKQSFPSDLAQNCLQKPLLHSKRQLGVLRKGWLQEAVLQQGELHTAVCSTVSVSCTGTTYCLATALPHNLGCITYSTSTHLLWIMKMGTEKTWTQCLPSKGWLKGTKLQNWKSRKQHKAMAASLGSEPPFTAPRDSAAKQQERKQAAQRAEEIKIADLWRGLPWIWWKDNIRPRQTEAKQPSLPALGENSSAD